MGYHIMPNAPFALIGARLFGAKAIYQMTGGPVQIVEGGFRSENPILRATGGPSKIQETLVYALVRCFDAVVVRGSKAQQFVIDNDLSRHCFVVTGAIDTERFAPSDESKDIDLIYVGRLVDNKGVEEYLAAVNALAKRYPQLRAGAVGDGPMRPEFERRIAQYGLTDRFTFFGKLADVTIILKRSRLFVLLSPSEGMSIAMLEAMSCGVPVVVTNVGDHSDVLLGKGGGILVDQCDPQTVADEMLALLQDKALWQQRSREARATILDQCSVAAMTRTWARELTTLMT
jgi:glycosyltransferase involved in cell wall biosynthesis